SAARKLLAPPPPNTVKTGESEWYTLIQYIDSARQVMGGIDLDPASCEHAQKYHVQACYYCTKEDNGLEQDWHGRVWLNPPYSKDLMPQFVDKLIEEYAGKRHVEQAIMLTHNFTDTRWFHNAESVCAAICFTSGRIGFEQSDGPSASPTNGQAFFYFGDHAGKFGEVFSQHSFVR